jgi:hypothetical protein
VVKGCKMASPFMALALVLVRFDHVATIIVNANHSIVRAAAKLCVVNCIADRVWLAVPQASEWQHIGNQIDAASVFAWSDFVKVHFLVATVTDIPLQCFDALTRDDRNHEDRGY